MDEKAELTIKDVAYILGITRTTVYNRQRSGDLPYADARSIIWADIEKREQELIDIRNRFKERVAERLVVSA